MHYHFGESIHAVGRKHAHAELLRVISLVEEAYLFVELVSEVQAGRKLVVVDYLGKVLRR